MKPRRDWAALAAVAGLALTMLACAFGLYGRFVRQEQRQEAIEKRMDEADGDRHTMMETLDRIEQRLIDMGTAFAAADPPRKAEH